MGILLASDTGARGGEPLRYVGISKMEANCRGRFTTLGHSENYETESLTYVNSELIGQFQESRRIFAMDYG